MAQNQANKRHQYQSFRDAGGASDSERKLKCLQLPQRLEGKSVLDIACNEGFFCQEAWRRGAKRVVGIDKTAPLIERARQRDDRTEYQVMNWSRLRELDETFDLILLLSALHYAKDPSRVLRDAFELLSEDGMLVLECGVAEGSKPEWVPVERPVGDVVRHPTRSMIIRKAFPTGAARVLGPSVNQRGDPVPRFVFRVTPRKPVVMLIAGQSRSGKSILADELKSDSARVVRMDRLIGTLPDWCSNDQLVGLVQAESAGDKRVAARRIDAIGRAFASENVEDVFAEAVISSQKITRTPHAVTIVEGHVLGCGAMAEVFAERLTDLGAYVWHVNPSRVRPGLLGGPRRTLSPAPGSERKPD